MNSVKREAAAGSNLIKMEDGGSAPPAAPTPAPASEAKADEKKVKEMGRLLEYSRKGEGGKKPTSMKRHPILTMAQSKLKYRL